MKHAFALLSFFLLFLLPSPAQHYEVHTPNLSLAIDAPKGGTLKYRYFGSRLHPADLAQVEMMSNCDGEVYPAYGMGYARESALALTHADGNMSTQLAVESVNTSAEGNATLLTVRLKDKAYPLYVSVYFKAYADADMIETWTDIRHEERKGVRLTQFASGTLPVRRGDVWLSSLYGTWADEAQVCTEPLTPGVKVIENRDGVRNSQTAHAEIMLSLDGKPRENEGRVIGAALCYSGNYRLRLLTDETDYHTLLAGIDETYSARQLPRGETFTTPVLALTYSDEGLSGASRNFHRWGRTYRLMHGDRLRDILLNSWEGVYLNVNQQAMTQMMADFAAMGGELFVMDDGWFGRKYSRSRDNAALGDWETDTAKLPGGIEALLQAAHEHKVKFGIWIEPEMTNTQSELYEKHPDWVVKAPGRDLVTGRGGTQLVLDLSNPAVQEFVYGVVDNLLTRYPEIAYIKWDANMSVLNHGSQHLSADGQSHLFTDWHAGFRKVCERIRAKYPDVVIQACASGGGRANWGILPWFDEFWVSDNTDALQRIYMQWGTSYFFPALAMASHISASPNHQTGRIVPLKFRIDVAMSARLGMEIQPAQMSEAEKELCRTAIADYKSVRPIVQQGDIYRLLSPYDRKGLASLMYVSTDKSQAVFYWWKTEHFAGEHLPRVRMAGLDTNRTYRIHELNRIDRNPLPFEGKAFSGAFLMQNGLEIPYGHYGSPFPTNGYASRVLHLVAE